MKGNKSIRRYPANTLSDGKIIKALPMVPFGDTYVSLFSVMSPTICKYCGASLKINKHDSRYVISSYDLLEIPVRYQYCSVCSEPHSDHIVGVRDGANYSDEYLEKAKYTRYLGKCSLHNTTRVGEIFTRETFHKGRAPCATTIWKYEQKQGELSLTELRETEVSLNGKIYIDGIWIKTGYKKQLEQLLGRKISKRQWKRLRYKVVYVVATEEKVILDFQITERMPVYFELTPLFSRLKKRFGEENIRTVVSDEDWAIIDATKAVLPKANQAFCVFHQLEKINEMFFAVYQSVEEMSNFVKEVYHLSKQVLLAKNVIESTICLREMETKIDERRKIPAVIKNAYQYVLKKYHKNRKLFEAGLVPETNNTMEQIFSTFKDFVIQCRSFKIVSGVRNWIANLLLIKNKAPFMSGKNRGKSPLVINRESRASSVG